MFSNLHGPGTVTVYRYAYEDDIWFGMNGSGLTARVFRSDLVDQLEARIGTGGQVGWYLTDRQGSVRDIADNTGTVRDHLDYDGFGKILTETNSPFGDVYKYTGREFDSETGLQYNRARYYDPRVGRWTSEDSLGFAADDPNLYRYVGNSPTNRADPSGLQWVLQAAANATSNNHDLFDEGAGIAGAVKVWTDVWIEKVGGVKTPNGIFIVYDGTSPQKVRYYQVGKPVLEVARKIRGQRTISQEAVIFPGNKTGRSNYIRSG